LGFGEYLSLAPEARAGGRSVLLILARAADLGPDPLPADYQRLLTIVRDAAGPVTVRTVGEVLGLPVEVRGKLEPMGAEYRVAGLDRGFRRTRRLGSPGVVACSMRVNSALARPGLISNWPARVDHVGRASAHSRSWPHSRRCAGQRIGF
jgi:hypothetical protein